MISRIFLLTIFSIAIQPVQAQESDLNEHDHGERLDESQPSAAEYPEDSPNWLAMEEAIAVAQAENDIVLIHAYAPWCSWCRELDQTTYVDDSVQGYLSEHFQVTRLDIENDSQIEFFGGWVTMRELGSAFDVRSTPTTIFMDAQGNYLTKAPSYFPPDIFLLVLRYVNEQAYDMMNFSDYVEMIEASEG